MNTPKLHARLKKIYAANVLHLYQTKTRFDHWRLRHGLKLTTIVLLTAMLFSVFSMPFLHVTNRASNSSKSHFSPFSAHFNCK